MLRIGREMIRPSNLWEGIYMKTQLLAGAAAAVLVAGAANAEQITVFGP